jgi:hypothetical protein
MSDNHYIAVVPTNQKIYNTPIHHKQFSSIGVTVPDAPLDTIIQIVADLEYFRVPSSKAVYDAIRNLRDNTVQIDMLANYFNPNDANTLPIIQELYDQLDSKLDKSNVIQEVKDNVLNQVVSSDVIHDALQNLIVNQIDLQTYNFTTPSLQWDVIHNKNTMTFQESIFDTDGNKLYANIKIIDNNSFTIYLTELTSGFVTVKF